jgi:hypothetical protein
MRILEGVTGIKRLEDEAVRRMIHEDGQRAKEAFGSPCSWIELFVAFSIPGIAMVILFIDNIITNYLL